MKTAAQAAPTAKAQQHNIADYCMPHVRCLLHPYGPSIRIHRARLSSHAGHNRVLSKIDIGGNLQRRYLIIKVEKILCIEDCVTAVRSSPKTVGYRHIAVVIHLHASRL